MKILVDTSVWSLALRRSKEDQIEIRNQLKDLINECRVCIIGPIRQEILSGIPSKSIYQELKSYLQAFEDLEIITIDYERAAAMFNSCRKAGIQGSHIDFLICAIAERYDLAIFTFDNDFKNYAKQISIKLF